jgi:hypothetical protein
MSKSVFVVDISKTCVIVYFVKNTVQKVENMHIAM